MTSKKIFFWPLSLATLLLSGQALAAGSTVYHGAACHNYYGSDVSNIVFYSHGVTNLTQTDKKPKKVICPVTKSNGDYNGLSARVNIDSSAANTVKCTLYSYNWDGKSLGSKTVINRKHGAESLVLSVPTSTPRSHFSVICELPYKDTAEIYSVEALD